MLERLTITNYRGFRRLHIEGLARINLFVGPNNSGKTAILDALDLLQARPDANALWRAADRRGEATFTDEGNTTSGAWELASIDLSTIFHGRTVRAGDRFEIDAGPSGHLVAEVVPGTPPPSKMLPALQLRDETVMRDTLEIEGSTRVIREQHKFRDRSGSSRMTNPARNTLPVRFLGTHENVLTQIRNDWNEVVLTPGEDAVIDAIQQIEPRIRRIAYVGEEGPWLNPRGFVVSLEGHEGRVPLGNFGDGTKRILATAVNAVSASGGMLFVDEIDTGLHYAAMGALWKTVHRIATRMDVQVFATTHSIDCVYALGRLCEDDAGCAADIALHRVEKDAEATMRYSAEEILAAARESIEVR